MGNTILKSCVWIAVVAIGALALSGRAAEYPCETHARMQPSRQSPEWLRRGVVYQFKTANFTPEGTIRSAQARLGYLADLGVNVVYTIPVFVMDDDNDPRYGGDRLLKMGLAKSPYRIKDFFHVDPAFGTDQDLRDFIAEAHRLGLKVIMDVVYLHAGCGARVFKDYPATGRRRADGSLRPGTWKFPVFDYTNPATREYFLTNLTYLQIDYGVDGFRCDVGTAVPLDFWCDGRKRLEALRPGDIALLCEGFEPNTQVTAFDADYGWFRGEKVFSKGESANERIRRYWEAVEHESTKGAKFIRHYENHDLAVQIRPRREATWGAAFTEQVLAWMFFSDGVPMLFSGNEIADTSDSQAWAGRRFIDWSQAEAEPGRSRLEYVKRLIELRKTRRELTDGCGRLYQIWLDTSLPDDVTAFVRRSDAGKMLLVVQNWRDRTLEADVSFANTKESMPDWLKEEDDPDLTVRGSVGNPLLVRRASFAGNGRFRLEGYGMFVAELRGDGVRYHLQGFGKKADGATRTDFVAGRVE